MRKIFLILGLAVGVLLPQQIGAGEQLWDWAWSDSIGWVSFRNDNTNAHWAIVENDDGDFIYQPNNANNRRDMFKVEDPPLGMTQSISRVRIRIRFRGELEAGVLLNGSDTWVYVDDRSNQSTRWADFNTTPTGRSWTWDDVEDMQVGVGLKRGSSGTGRGEIYEVYVVVEHTSGSETLNVNGTGAYTGIQSPTPEALYGYGVEADRETGELSGYAWSSNIGWISFEPVSVSGCPIAPCQAYIDFDTAEVFGWARACSVFSSGCSGGLRSNLGGWQGWIRFNGLLYSAELNDTVNPSEFFNWAWGDNKVIGWLSLNNTNTGGPIDYEVKTNLKLNAPPVAAFNCNPSTCQVYRGETLILDNVSTDPDGNDQIDLCQWSWDDLTDALGYSLFQSCSPPPDPNLCDTTFGSTRGNWNVKLYVEDEKGAFDEVVREVTVLREISADFLCSVNSGPYQSCGDISLVEGDTLDLQDDSTASEFSFGTSAAINSWTWYLNGSPAVYETGNPVTVDPVDITTPSMTIKLKVEDTNNHSAEITKNLFGVMPLPTWREIAPF